jgi:O-methyltransferase
MARFGKLKESLLRSLRATGYDIVRCNALPQDLDPSIAETVRRVKPYTLTSVQRIAALCEAVRYVVQKRIPGDIVECGVWKGGSMMAVARTLLGIGDQSRHLYLYDTFEGMTAPTDKDVSLLGQKAADLLKTESKSDPGSVWCRSPLKSVQQALSSVGYDMSRMHFVKGRVEDTIPREVPERIALLRLDTDWYESTRHELEHLYPRLSVGGVLIIDDYGHWHGARQAVDEYMREHGMLLLHRIDYSGRCAVKVA